MFSKTIVALVVLSAFLLAYTTVDAQNNNLVGNLVKAVNGLTKILGGLGTILANPASLLNGQLGGNVGAAVDNIVDLVGALGVTVDDLLRSLGLATS